MDYQEDYIEGSTGADRAGGDGTIQDRERQDATDEVGGVNGTYNDVMMIWITRRII